MRCSLTIKIIQLVLILTAVGIFQWGEYPSFGGYPDNKFAFLVLASALIITPILIVWNIYGIEKLILEMTLCFLLCLCLMSSAVSAIDMWKDAPPSTQRDQSLKMAFVTVMASFAYFSDFLLIVTKVTNDKSNGRTLTPSPHKDVQSYMAKAP